ncbi:MAG: cation:proton antiporter [Pseudomonadota bacterium]
MAESTAVFAIFLIFTGAAVLATFALMARQAMIVAYIVVGFLLGPAGFGWVHDEGWLAEVSSIGIMFLLYLLGLNMLPSRLWQMLSEALGVTLISCLAFAVVGAVIAAIFGFGLTEALLIGGCTMFSSTIIGLKLLPTTTLHHKHTGQMMISVLLLQDLIAIIFLLVVQGYGEGSSPLSGIAREMVALPVVVGVALVAEKYVMEPLIARFDQIHEYVFLLVIAWCLAIAEGASALGLSHEIGAFIAGVALADCPVSAFISESLKPLRDFFLVLFFFSLGASFDTGYLLPTIMPAIALSVGLMLAKPFVFQWLFVHAGERRRQSFEVGVRLGQLSEFSLLIAFLAMQTGLFATRSAYVVQLAVMITFVVSSYLIVMRYPTPIAVRDSLRRD